jgi:hypothetical protein
MTGEEVEEVERQEEYELQKLREFDQQVRLTTFRWHSNKFASQIIRQVYGDLKETDPAWQIHKVKLFDNVRTQKNQMLAKLEVGLLPYGKRITVKMSYRTTSRQLGRNARGSGLWVMTTFVSIGLRCSMPPLSITSGITLKAGSISMEVKTLAGTSSGVSLS